MSNRSRYYNTNRPVQVIDVEAPDIYESSAYLNDRDRLKRLFADSPQAKTIREIKLKFDSPFLGDLLDELVFFGYLIEDTRIVGITRYRLAADGEVKKKTSKPLPINATKNGSLFNPEPRPKYLNW